MNPAVLRSTMRIKIDFQFARYHRSRDQGIEISREMLTTSETVKVGINLTDEVILIDRSITRAPYPTTAVSTIT